MVMIQIIINSFSSFFAKKLYITDDDSFGKIWSLVTWLTFVLINAFYSGALTMFFSTPAVMPFDSIEDVLDAVPSWNLIILDGTNAWFQNKADRVMLLSKNYL